MLGTLTSESEDDKDQSQDSGAWEEGFHDTIPNTQNSKSVLGKFVTVVAVENDEDDIDSDIQEAQKQISIDDISYANKVIINTQSNSQFNKKESERNERNYYDYPSQINNRNTSQICAERLESKFYSDQFDTQEDIYENSYNDEKNIYDTPKPLDKVRYSYKNDNTQSVQNCNIERTSSDTQMIWNKSMLKDIIEGPLELDRISQSDEEVLSLSDWDYEKPQSTDKCSKEITKRVNDDLQYAVDNTDTEDISTTKVRVACNKRDGYGDKTPEGRGKVPPLPVPRQFVTVVSVDGTGSLLINSERNTVEANLKVRLDVTTNISNSNNNYVGDDSNYDMKTSVSQDVSDKTPRSSIPDQIIVFRLPGERLGLGLKFDGGVRANELVKRLFIQSVAFDSPAARAAVPWGKLQPGDQIINIEGRPVPSLTRVECVSHLKDASVKVTIGVLQGNGKLPELDDNSFDNRNEIGYIKPLPQIVGEMRKRVPPPPLPPRSRTKKSPARPPKEQASLPPPHGFEDNLFDSCYSKVTKNYSELSYLEGFDNNIGLPPAPAVYLDLLGEEDEAQTICESESDETNSSASTVIDRMSLSSTPTLSRNSSFSATAELNRFDISRALSPFEQLERELAKEIRPRALSAPAMESVEPFEIVTCPPVDQPVGQTESQPEDGVSSGDLEIVHTRKNSNKQRVRQSIKSFSFSLKGRPFSWHQTRGGSTNERTGKSYSRSDHFLSLKKSGKRPAPLPPPRSVDSGLPPNFGSPLFSSCDLDKTKHKFAKGEISPQYIEFDATKKEQLTEGENPALLEYIQYEMDDSDPRFNKELTTFQYTDNDSEERTNKVKSTDMLDGPIIGSNVDKTELISSSLNENEITATFTSSSTSNYELNELDNLTDPLTNEDIKRHNQNHHKNELSTLNGKVSDSETGNNGIQNISNENMKPDASKIPIKSPRNMLSLALSKKSSDNFLHENSTTDTASKNSTLKLINSSSEYNILESNQNEYECENVESVSNNLLQQFFIDENEDDSEGNHNAELNQDYTGLESYMIDEKIDNFSDQIEGLSMNSPDVSSLGSYSISSTSISSREIEIMKEEERLRGASSLSTIGELMSQLSVEGTESDTSQIHSNENINEEVISIQNEISCDFDQNEKPLTSKNFTNLEIENQLCDAKTEKHESVDLSMPRNKVKSTKLDDPKRFTQITKDIRFREELGEILKKDLNLEDNVKIEVEEEEEIEAVVECETEEELNIIMNALRKQDNLAYNNR